MNNMQEANQGQVEQIPFGAVQHNLSNIPLTTSEIGHLWTSYLAECMSVCFLKNFVAQSTDPDIISVLQRALDVSNQRIKTMEDIYNSIHHPIPEGFGETDVNATSEHLFSEIFNIKFTRLMHKFVLTDYLNSLSAATRSDVRSYFSECIDTSKEIHQKATEVLLSKGLLMKAPTIPIPDGLDFVHDKDYFGSILGIGNKRSLNAIEISHIVAMMETKQLFLSLKLGYGQVVKSEKIKDFIKHGRKVANNQLKELGSLLDDEELPQPTITSNSVTDSTESPYSDKLILSHITFAIASIIAEDGYTLTNMSRIDLVAAFSSSIIELLSLAKDGAELMIENGWLERVPEAADRKKLMS